MEDRQQQNSAVKNIFQNGSLPTGEAYTKLWIRMICQIEETNQLLVEKEGSSCSVKKDRKA